MEQPTDQWRAYRHRRDDSVTYEARRSETLEEGYEVRHPGGSAAWTVDAQTFEESYEPAEDA